MSQLSPSEKKGLLILLGIVLIGFIFQWLQPFEVKTDLYDYSVQDSVFKSLAANNAISGQDLYAGQKNANIKDLNTPKLKTSILTLNSININTASQSQLEKLPRIGPATAKNILEYRNKNGRFKSIDELINVKRIGPKTLEVIKPYLTIK